MGRDYSRRRYSTCPEPMEFEITIDDAYLKEHYEEWVAAKAPNTRRVLKLGLGLIVVGAVICLAQITTETLGERFGRAGLLAFVLGGYLRFACARRRGTWLRVAKSLGGYGMTHVIFVYDGMLMAGPPKKVGDGDCGTAEITSTPRGYLVRFPDTNRSVYLPHRLLEPPTTREAFLGAIRVPESAGADSEDA